MSQQVKGGDPSPLSVLVKHTWSAGSGSKAPPFEGHGRTGASPAKGHCVEGTGPSVILGEAESCYFSLEKGRLRGILSMCVHQMVKSKEDWVGIFLVVSHENRWQ